MTQAGRGSSVRCSDRKLWALVLRTLQSVDLNLLVALELLLEEENVTEAARRYGRSVPAMSRMLARLREMLDDPLLVRAGRRLTPTPRARALRPALSKLIADAQSMLEPPDFDPAALTRQFTIQSNEDLASSLSGVLVTAVKAEAPGVSLRFAPEGRESEDALRNGRVDVDIGAGAALHPEIISEVLFRQMFVGAARIGHPLFERPITAQSFASVEHIVRSRRGQGWGPIDEAMSRQGLARRVALIVPSARAAITVAARSDLVATGPASFVRSLIAEGVAVRAFELPVATPAIEIALSWHPQFHADPAHRWFRKVIMTTFGTILVGDPGASRAPAPAVRPRRSLAGAVQGD